MENWEYTQKQHASFKKIERFVDFIQESFMYLGILLMASIYFTIIAGIFVFAAKQLGFGHVLPEFVDSFLNHWL